MLKKAWKKIMTDPIHILLIEDDPEKIRTIWNMLHEKSRFQFEIEAVTGMPEAMNRLEQDDIDVALLDLSLVSFDAETEAVQEILKAYPHLALLVLTELENEQAGLRAIQAGAQDYLLKHEIATVALVRALHYAVERQRAEALIHVVEEQRHIATNSLVDYGIITLDEQGRVTDWNQGAINVFGYTEAAILGQHFERLFTPQDRAKNIPQQELTQTREQGFSEDERWHLRQDDSRFYASGMTRPIYDPKHNILGFVKIVRDVTEAHNRQMLEQEQRTLAESLRDTAIALNSSLNLKEVLDLALESAHRLLKFRAGVLICLENGKITHFASNGLKSRDRVTLERWYWRQTDVNAVFPYQSVANTRQPAIIQNNRTRDSHLPAAFGSRLLIAPLATDDTVMGYLTFINTEPDEFSDTDVRKLDLFRHQVVAAIQNAHLFVHAQELAVLQERQQIARDLHDAVMQTLFSATIMMQLVQRQFESKPEEVPQMLVNAEQMIQGAMAEMRTLLLEMRPDNLPTTPFKKLLEQLMAAAQARKKIAIDLQADGEPVLPAHVHIMLYRLAQEAINNVVKHAEATALTITMRGGTNFIDLVIKDNGNGFSTDAPSSGLGLQIMQERSEEINAEIEIESSPGNGTTVHVIWSAADVNPPPTQN